jgi:hypothetical protein
MKSDGHRPSHITRDLPRIINLVFTPTKAELQEAEMFLGAPANCNQHYHSQLPQGN